MFSTFIPVRVLPAACDHYFVVLPPVSIVLNKAFVLSLFGTCGNLEAFRRMLTRFAQLFVGS